MADLTSAHECLDAASANKAEAYFKELEHLRATTAQGHPPPSPSQGSSSQELAAAKDKISTLTAMVDDLRKDKQNLADTVNDLRKDKEHLLRSLDRPLARPPLQRLAYIAGIPRIPPRRQRIRRGRVR